MASLFSLYSFDDIQVPLFLVIFSLAAVFLIFVSLKSLQYKEYESLNVIDDGITKKTKKISKKERKKEKNDKREKLSSEDATGSVSVKEAVKILQFEPNEDFISNSVSSSPPKLASENVAKSVLRNKMERSPIVAKSVEFSHSRGMFESPKDEIEMHQRQMKFDGNNKKVKENMELKGQSFVSACEPFVKKIERVESFKLKMPHRKEEGNKEKDANIGEAQMNVPALQMALAKERQANTEITRKAQEAELALQDMMDNITVLQKESLRIVQEKQRELKSMEIRLKQQSEFQVAEKKVTTNKIDSYVADIALLKRKLETSCENHVDKGQMEKLETEMSVLRRVLADVKAESVDTSVHRRRVTELEALLRNAESKAATAAKSLQEEKAKREEKKESKVTSKVQRSEDGCTTKNLPEVSRLLSENKDLQERVGTLRQQAIHAAEMETEFKRLQLETTKMKRDMENIMSEAEKEKVKQRKEFDISRTEQSDALAHARKQCVELQGNLQDAQKKLSEQLSVADSREQMCSELKTEVGGLKVKIADNEKMKEEIEVLRLNNQKPAESKKLDLENVDLQAKMAESVKLKEEIEDLKSKLTEFENLKEEMEKLKLKLKESGTIKEENEDLKLKIKEHNNSKDAVENLNLKIADVEKLTAEAEILKLKLVESDNLKIKAMEQLEAEKSARVLDVKKAEERLSYKTSELVALQHQREESIREMQTKMRTSLSSAFPLFQSKVLELLPFDEFLVSLVKNSQDFYIPLSEHKEMSDSYQKQLTTTSTNLEKLQSCLSQEDKTHKEQLAKVESEKDSLKSSLDSWKSKHDCVVCDYATLQNSFKTTKDDIEKRLTLVAKDLQQRTEENTALQTQMNRLNEECSSSKHLITDLQSELQHNKDLIVTLNEKLNAKSYSNGSCESTYQNGSSRTGDLELMKKLADRDGQLARELALNKKLHDRMKMLEENASTGCADFSEQSGSLRDIVTGVLESNLEDDSGHH